MQPPRIIVIVGPTASGKTSLSVELARKLNGEVISADSRQVYIGLNIGTGKVSKSEMKGIHHHLLDVASPKKVFSAGDFVSKGRTALDDILARGKTPIICGGTAFYIDALLGRITLPAVSPNPTFRKRLESKSATQLFALLQKRDPVRALQMDTPSERNNPVRLIRALEVAASKRPESPLRYVPAAEVVWLGISWPQDKLDARIGKRLSARLKIGMIAEAKRLHAAGLSYKRMESLGLEYRSLAHYLKGIITRTELEAELRRDISRYSKKQMLWWRRNKDIAWLSAPVSTATAIRHLGGPRARVRAPRRT